MAGRVGEEAGDPVGDPRLVERIGRATLARRRPALGADQLDPAREQVVGERGDELGMGLDRPGPFADA